MRKLIAIIISVILAGTAVQAQSLTGQVKSRGGEELVNSTVMLLDTKDSSMISFGKSVEGGHFNIKTVQKESVLLQVTNVGFEKFMMMISTTGQNQNIGVVYLDSASIELDDVVIKGERAAIEINKDTIEYNAGSFKVGENAMVEDLLKKLPGVEVDRDGTITAQGKSVPRILVDGKEFFGRDPKMATKNIPADAINKVQVFDKKSDRAEFTGIDDGEEETTINLVLREDKKNLGFGRITTAGGADSQGTGRYNLAGSYNSFKNGNQLSFLGNLNNINQRGFSNAEFSMAGLGRGGFGGGGFGSFGGGIGGGSGLTRSISAGMNFNNKITSKTELNGSYSYTNTDQYTEREGNKRSVIGNLETEGESGSEQNSDNDSHRLNVTLNSKINPKNSIRWVNRVDYRNNSSNSHNEDFERMIQTGELRNSTVRDNISSGNTLGLTSQALYQLGFDKRGRTFTTNLSIGINNSSSDGTMKSLNGLFDQSLGGLKFENLNQINNQINNRLNLNAELSYTEPINAFNFLEFNYSFQKVYNVLDKEVFDIDEASSKTLNNDLTNKYNNDYTYNRAGISYRISKDKWNGNVGVALQDSKLYGDLVSKNEIIEKRYTNPVYNGRIRYSFTSSKSMDLSYNSNISEPSMTQLSPIPDNSNPLNIYVGNPDLKPQYSQRLNINFRNFNQLMFTNFFVSAGMNFTNDKITNKIVYDEVTLAQTRTPINYGNDFSTNLSANYGFRIRPINTRFSVNSRVNYSRSLTLINNVDNLTNTTTNANTVRADFTPGDNFNMGLSAMVTFNNSVYSQNNALNPSYVNQTYTSDLEWKIPQLFTVTSAFDFGIYNYTNSDQTQKIPLWNASIFRTILKNKRGEIRFSANDILGKNQVISQSATDNTFSENRINALGRYFLVSFTYNINGGISAAMGGRGGRGGFR